MTIDKSTIEYHFNAKFASGRIDFEPTYNAAPSQLLPIITTYAPTQLVLAKWGFLPEEWQSTRIRPQNNARVETAAEKPMFRTSFAGRHCMVLTDGFYEWKMVGTRKQPYRFVLTCEYSNPSIVPALRPTMLLRAGPCNVLRAPSPTW